jgi:zinc protease
MVKFRPAFLSLFVLIVVPIMLQSSDIFPFNYKVEELENGLKVISIPQPDKPEIISYYTIVRSGSRNEIEPGKSGFAHFFEHIMFKGTENVSIEEYTNFIIQLGAGTNGYTTDDYTCYYVVFAGRENLEEVVRLQADKFINLSYDEEMLKTEASVIEGVLLLKNTLTNTRLSATFEISWICPISLNTASFTELAFMHQTTPFFLSWEILIMGN